MGRPATGSDSTTNGCGCTPPFTDYYSGGAGTQRAVTWLKGGTFSSRYYTYDAKSRLVAVDLCNVSTTTCAPANRQATATISYNAQGQRASYAITGTWGTITQHFWYRGGQLGQVATVSGTTAYTDTYLYDPSGAPYELVRQQNGATNRYWYEKDGQGNVVALTDIHGNVVDSYQYDLWGNPTGASESVPQQLRYRGYWYDAVLGTYWLSVRQYDPVLKQFLQADPSQQEGLAAYAYAHSDPVDLADPSGMSSATIGTDNEAALCTAYGGVVDAIGGGGTTICVDPGYGSAAPPGEMEAEEELASGQETIAQILADAPCAAADGCATEAGQMTYVAEDGVDSQGYACALQTADCYTPPPSEGTTPVPAQLMAVPSEECACDSGGEAIGDPIAVDGDMGAGGSEAMP